MKVLSLLVFLLGFNLLQAQCGSNLDCNRNVGIFSNDNAADIAYDNMSSAFHTTYIKEPTGSWKVWGERVANDGNSNVLSPIEFNVANYPALRGTIYKMAIGSSYGLNIQLIVLTSEGIFVLGTENIVLSQDLTTSSTFQKIAVDGKADGLPLNVSPADVKMLFASSGTLMITTCDGAVYVLSTNSLVRGDGSTGNELQWSRVMQDATTPLSNVIVSRGARSLGFALKADGTIWTWGRSTNLGNGGGFIDRPYATQMYLPDGIPGVKMIQCTSRNDGGFSTGTNFVSYYILGTNKKVYSLGCNTTGQLGDRTAVDRLAWVNAKNPDGTTITDAAWISANEHDASLPALAVLKTNGVIYTCGCNSYYMVGRANPGTGLDGDVNYLDLPTGISATDYITFAETGGHTCALIKRCTPKYGYVGHRVRGSIGDGSTVDETIASYDFTSPPAIAVCGAQFSQPIVVAVANSVCYNQSVTFTIIASAGDIISYRVNNGPGQDITIGPTGTAQVTVPNATINQTIYLTQVFSLNAGCAYDLSVTAIVRIMPPFPTFNQVNPICQGDSLSALPTTSNNGVDGTWSPAINNQQTTTYTFTPLLSCSETVTMTITVNPKIIPTFSQVEPICTGTTLSSLPTTSINGYKGAWSPALNNLQTTTYTFTPTPISGICLAPTTMTIVVSQAAIPTFNPVDPICIGATLSALPTTSNNSIEGTWAPALNNQQTTTYTFTPTNASCQGLGHITIVVNQPTPPVFPSFPALCFGDNQFALPLVSTNGISGSWAPQINPTTTTTYTFTPNTNECATTAQAEVPVLDDFDFNYEIKCLENNIVIEANSNPNNLEFSWLINNAVVFSGGSFNLSSYLATTPILEVFPIPLTISASRDYCSKTKDISVENSVCGIPNAITPNGDTLNESFDLSGFDVTKLEIYNRWGRKVYEKANYLNEWRGQNNKGNSLPDGVYFYVIDVSSGSSKTGWIFVRN